jgi:hypothetical protein
MSETLKKISFQNLQQFTEDLNKNFAIVQNSPLFKGIPGKEGDPGLVGLRGTRGSQIVFVNLQKFNEQFPGEYVNASQITLQEINVKMNIFEEKQKLLVALGLVEFVNNDIVVLTNSIMLSYDIYNDLFVDTRLAFNEQSNLVSSIEGKIEEYVSYYIQNHPGLNSVNVFNSFATKAKNYTDTSGGLTTVVTPSSVFTPHYIGVTTDSGPTIADHKYFGYSDSEFPIGNRGSMVFGSLKKYIEILMATTDVSQPNTLSSDFAPTNTNIPSLVILQDTVENGIMIGRKNAANLKRFGSIFKDVNDNLIIKSDQGKNANDFSKITLSRTSFRYDKKMFLDNDLEIAQDLILTRNINNQFLRSGAFAGDTAAAKTIEIGSTITGSVQKNISDNILLTKFVNKVLVTGLDGEISKEFSLEKANKPSDGSAFVGSDKRLATSDYIQWLYNLIAVTGASLSSYWAKADFAPTNAVIPKLKLTTDLSIGNDVVINSNRDYSGRNGTFSGNLTKIGGNNTQFIFENDSLTNNVEFKSLSGGVTTGIFRTLHKLGWQIELLSGGITSAGDINVATGKKFKINNADLNFSHLAGIIGNGQLPERVRELAQEVSGNLNDLKISGWYQGTNLTNAPSTARYYIQVIAYTTSNVIQILYTQALNRDIYTRNLISGVWTTWNIVYNSATLTKAVIESLLTGEISSHTHAASGISSGQFILDRMPRATSGFLRGKGTTTNPAYETLIAADIPNLSATKITTDQFDAARIPNLDTSKITTGQFILDRMPRAIGGFLKATSPSTSPIYAALLSGDIPNLPASKITTEQFSLDRMPRATAGFLKAKGTTTTPAYEALSAADITGGVLPIARGGTNASTFAENRMICIDAGALRTRTELQQQGGKLGIIHGGSGGDSWIETALHVKYGDTTLNPYRYHRGLLIQGPNEVAYANNMALLAVSSYSVNGSTANYTEAFQVMNDGAVNVRHTAVDPNNVVNKAFADAKYQRLDTSQELTSTEVINLNDTHSYCQGAIQRYGNLRILTITACWRKSSSVQTLDGSNSFSRICFLNSSKDIPAYPVYSILYHNNGTLAYAQIPANSYILYMKSGHTIGEPFRGTFVWYAKPGQSV